VTNVNWDVFAGLPGAATSNFERLCRALVRRHYAKYGDFTALANQPGVEFHLRLRSDCSLGEAGRWFGWQCRWYELPPGRPIGTARRRKIAEALAQSESDISGLTDWILWTRHPLTEGDQDWFHALPHRCALHLWTSFEVEEHLSGSAEILRATYFGELVLTTDLLNDLHAAAVAPVRRRWMPEVHQVLDSERVLRRELGDLSAWRHLETVRQRLDLETKSLGTSLSEVPHALIQTTRDFLEVSRTVTTWVSDTHGALTLGDYEIVRQQLKRDAPVLQQWDDLIRQLRVRQSRFSLAVTNVLADLHEASEALGQLADALERSLVAVVADAGYGKTELAAQLTAATADRPAGLLLHGSDLHAGQHLDDLAHRVTIGGKQVSTFEGLVAALDAAGERSGHRLPIVIDGLNEAEDPRDWSGQLASVRVTLSKYRHVMVIVTLRSAFAKEALPEGVDILEITGFDDDTDEAIRKYFDYFKIDATDANIPRRMLSHPLTLRMFCEVTNPERKKRVGVEAMPLSLTALFDRYLEQVAERVAELSPRTWRYYESDVSTALSTLALQLWSDKARSLELRSLRRLIGDESRPWNESMVRALEHDGVLFRIPGETPGAGRVTVIFDALAGHVIADALLGRFGGEGFDEWIRSPEVTDALFRDSDVRHPLAPDILKALAGLTPRRTNRRQLWPLLSEPARQAALLEAALLEARYLDHETVIALAGLVSQSPAYGRDFLDRLAVTRAAKSHPLNADFLDVALRRMTVADRDLRWSEWLRKSKDAIASDCEQWEQRWRSASTIDPEDRLRTRWLMWTLTSTVRLLRDQATRSLYEFGCLAPDALFDLTIDSLSINDPYVPERMLASCYGVAMSLWADPRGDKLRLALPAFAARLVELMFVPNASHSTRHALMRNYALGSITLGLRIKPNSLPQDNRQYLVPPFAHLPTPFRPADSIADAEIADADRAVQMDFGNYTIGYLIPNRQNYDNRHPTYRAVRRQIDARIVELGFSQARFGSIDNRIGEDSWRGEYRGAPKIDRYGKKYSWVAYFEMYGVRQDNGELPDSRTGERPLDVDIDPSFPAPRTSWVPVLANPFTGAGTEPRKWMAGGPTPNHDGFLTLADIDGHQGPWVLLDGHVDQSSERDDRRVFTFLRGLFISPKRRKDLFQAFRRVQYPGTPSIPEAIADHYTFAGEIPWSSHFGTPLRAASGRVKRDSRGAFAYHDGRRWIPGIPVEVPIYEFAWSNSQSPLPQPGRVTVPAPALCDVMRLTSRKGEWDFYDSIGKATIARRAGDEEKPFRFEALYVREDLLTTYLRRTNQELVWLMWGERTFVTRTALGLGRRFSDVFGSYKHIHRRAGVWKAPPAAGSSKTTGKRKRARRRSS
jgi:hypothetical protein